MPCRWVIYLIVIAYAACDGHKNDLAGEAPVDPEVFKAAFPVLTLQKAFYDTSIYKIADTVTISYTVFTQFVPDSLLKKKNEKPVKTVIHPVGRIERANELYLLANFIQGKKIKLVTFVFDKKFRYLATLELLNNYSDDEYMYAVLINSEPTFIIVRQKTGKENNVLYTRNGFGYNKATHDFIVVLNDTNEDLKKQSEIINPIDTLPRHNKFSGDYVQNKKNFISLRDGRDKDVYFFFIHFEKNDGACNGELKGEMKMRNAANGYFQKSGDPCIIDFSFEDNEITVKERGNCGNHRGIKCFFNDSYTRKKEKKTK